MHRSGTSSVAGTFVKLGLDAPGTLMRGDRYNAHGYWESERLVALNDEILATVGSRWDDWRPFDPAWCKTVESERFRRRARQILEEEYGDSALIVVKDPRLCRLMPFWSRIFSDDGWALTIVLPLRSPIEVAASLAERDGFTIEKSAALWLRHTLDAELASRGFPRAVMDWAGLLDNWRETLERVCAQSGLAFPATPPTEALEDFISPSLRHHTISLEDFTGDTAVNGWVLQTFGAMLALAANPEDRAMLQSLDQVRREFDAASRLFGPLCSDLERSLAAGETETRTLRTELDTARAEIASLNARLEGAARLHEAEAATNEMLRASLVESNARMERLDVGNAALLAQVAEARAENDALRRDYASGISMMNERLNQLLESRSWRLTAPYRAAGRILKTLLGAA